MRVVLELEALVLGYMTLTQDRDIGIDFANTPRNRYMTRRN